jgi:two-component system, NtrC family, nitrogen regulation sensor histidine kinase NtrY
VAVIGLLLAGGSWLLVTGMILPGIATGLLALMQTIALIRYVDRTNREVARFFEAVRYDDFSNDFSLPTLGASYRELGSSLEHVAGEFRRIRSEKEETLRYMQTVVQHVGVGVVAFRSDGSVELINTAAKRLLGVTHLKHMDALDRIDESLGFALLSLQPGERTVFRLGNRDEPVHLSMSVTEFKLRTDLYRLVSLQNIQAELEEQEAAAWQQLTQVLTHEIMNSITPITSLASTAREMLEDAGNGDANEALTDAHSAVKTIEKRSRGLLGFVQSYRRLMRVPAPDRSIVSVKEMIDGVTALFETELASRRIILSVKIDPESLEIAVDQEMIEQVLINLMRNAIDALRDYDAARISVRAYQDGRGYTLVELSDNGPGIEPDVIDRIFIPFFTTKKEGSGIGLSLARQIMRQHGGAIRVRSVPFEETVFTLRF